MFNSTLKSTMTAAIIISSSSLTPFTAAAQDADAEKTFIYASYFSCPGGDMREVDKVVKEELTPIYDAGVEDGTIKGWGWSVHHTGGRWQRIFSHTSNSVDALLKSANTMNERSVAANVDPDNKFGKICNAHDDYIWEIQAGSDVDTQGKAALSVYYQCDVTREDRTDEIMKNIFAPIYEANMGEGKLTSWTWASHVFGGKYRRAVFTSADNYTDLLKSTGDILDAIYGDGGPAEGMEFAKICHGHSDYLWNRVN